MTNEDVAPDSTPKPEANSNVDENTKLRLELGEWQRKAGENYDLYLRALAEAENSRKRAQKERSDAIKFCLEDFFKELLPVMDSFDKALSDDKGETADLQAFKTGVVLVHKKLSEALERSGVGPIEALGQPFDPNKHQAIRRIEQDVREEVVHEEYAKGYMLHDRLLRPSMVSVAVPKG